MVRRNQGDDGMPGSNRDIRVRRMEDDLGSQAGSKTKKLKFEKAREDWGAPVLEQTSQSSSSKPYIEAHPDGAKTPTSPPTTTTPGEQQVEVGCDKSTEAGPQSKQTLLLMPPPWEEETFRVEYYVHADDLSKEREESILMEEQSNPSRGD